MSSYLRFPFYLLCACFLALACASNVRAQCGTNTLGYGDVGIVTGNPLTAEIVVTKPDADVVQSPLAQRPRSVARDSQGRVRTERVTEIMFKHDTGAEAGTEAEDHMIMICDPVAQTLTQIDTLNATAKIIHSRPSAPSSSTHSTELSPARPQRTFCSSRLPSSRGGHFSVEDLGDQIIEGVEAHGVRMKMPMIGMTTSEASSGSENMRDVWCSDDLSAVVLTVSENTKAGTKTTVAMQHIARNEPDAALFQIPADYAVTESVPETRDHQSPHVFTGTTR